MMKKIRIKIVIFVMIALDVLNVNCVLIVSFVIFWLCVIDVNFHVFVMIVKICLKNNTVIKTNNLQKHNISKRYLNDWHFFFFFIV